MDTRELLAKVVGGWAAENSGCAWLVASANVRREAADLLESHGWALHDRAGVVTLATREGYAKIMLFSIEGDPQAFAGLQPPGALVVEGGKPLFEEAAILAEVQALRWFRRANGETAKDGDTLALQGGKVVAQSPSRTLFVSSVVPLTEREIGAGTDLPSGAPALVLEGLRALGIDAPNQRYILSPEAAIRVGSALLAAADPTLVPALLKLAVAERPLPGGKGEG